MRREQQFLAWAAGTPRPAALHFSRSGDAYADLKLGFVDASTIALCERLGETRIATLDHRDFSMVRPRHCPHLTLLPD